jgi:hypothetical protein
MNHDDSRTPADVRFRAAGPGLSQTFRCPECDQFRGMFGRRLMRVRKGGSKGLTALICSHCVGERQPA